jgi:hypothetical protein
MARVSGVQDHEAGLRTRIIFWLAKRRRGWVHQGLRIRAHDPKLLQFAFRMDLHSASARTVPLILKELAQLKVATMVGCPL